MKVVEQTPDRAAPTVVEIQLAAGDRLRVPSGTAVEWLAALVAALRPRC